MLSKIIKLEDILEDYMKNNDLVYEGSCIAQFMDSTIHILKDLIQEQENIYKELAQKEDVINVNEIKEAKLINEG